MQAEQSDAPGAWGGVWSPRLGWFHLSCVEPAAAESSPKFRLGKSDPGGRSWGAAVAQSSHLGCSFPERSGHGPAAASPPVPGREQERTCLGPADVSVSRGLS